jgi:outer membrane autotransporter protein
LIQNFINSKKKDIAEHVKLNVIPEPPTADSETEKLDLSGHLLFTDMEEGSRLDLAEADQDEDSEYLNDIFYKATLGQYESLFDLDKQRDLVKLAELNTKWSKGYSEFKEHFDRARPRDAVEDGEFVEDHDLLGGSSYPSGHTWKGYQRSATLMQLFPERADEIFSRAIQYGESRVIVGAHFPMDTIASRIGNLYFTAVLMDNPDYAKAIHIIVKQTRAGVETACGELIRECLDKEPTAVYDQHARDGFSVGYYGQTSSNPAVLLTANDMPVLSANLLLPRFSYLTDIQRLQILASTAYPSNMIGADAKTGQPSWGLINLPYAMNGISWLHDNLHVAQNPGNAWDYAGFGARDTWRNAIGGPGSITKSGLGSLTLAGRNTYRGDTIVDGGELAIAREGSIISSAVVNDTGRFLVDGEAADVSVNKGGALRVGESGTTLGAFINGGTASIDGTSGTASVQDGGVLSGTGTLGSLDMRADGHVAPGHSIGTLNVIGNASFEKGSYFDVEVAADADDAGGLKADLLKIDGKAKLDGGIVAVSLENEKNMMSKEQVENLFLRKSTILTATQGVSGTFERALPEYSYITGLLDYSDTGKVSIGFNLTDAEKAKVARKLKADLLAAQNEANRLEAKKLAADKLAASRIESELLAAQNEAKRLQIEMLEQAMAGLTMENAGTAAHNQKAVFDAVKALGYGNPLTNTIFLKERGVILNYDGLSGEVQATLAGVLARDASAIGNAAQNRMRAAFDGVTVKEQATTAPLAFAPAQGAKTSDAFDAVTPPPATTALWGEAYGAFAHAAGDGNAAGYSRDTGGFVTGLDGVVAETWRMGMLAGYGNTSLDSGVAKASVDSYSVGLYGGTAWDNLRLSLGTALSQNEIDAERTAAFGDLVNRHSASYDAKSVQVFGELGYAVRSAYADFEPFAAASYVHLKTGGFQENGEISNLTGLGGTTDLTTTTLGLRASREFALSDRVSLTARGLLGWSHAFGDVTPAAKLAFAGGQPFDVEGLAVARDTGIVEAGFDFTLSPSKGIFGKATTLGLTYSGQFSDSASNNAIKADLTVRF